MARQTTTIRLSDNSFVTSELPEAALMLMRTGRLPQCRWEKRRCTFLFEGCTSEDMDYACSDPLVRVSDYQKAFKAITETMYRQRDER